MRERADQAAEAHARFAEAQGQVAAISAQVDSGDFAALPRPDGPKLPLANREDELERLIEISSADSAAAVEALRSLLRDPPSQARGQEFVQTLSLLDLAVAREADRADRANFQADLGTAAALVFGTAGIFGLFLHFDRQRRREMAVHLAELQWQAFHDPLTGLGNRRKLESDFERLAALSGQVAAVIVIDLDRFKHFNDRFGHDAGDKLLVEVSRELATRLGPDRLYRVGGDEFSLLVSAERLAMGIRPELFRSLSARAGVSASWGMATVPTSGRSLGETLRLADEQMYSHKRRNRAGGKARLTSSPNLSGATPG